ncbi:MAG TPA: potassium channel protein [Terriglobales bacterium]|nr:potassium channel protein [Terriglobales bacterium]
MLRRRLISAGILFLSLITVSVAGYRLLGGPSVTFLQALYMAVITLAGVGYGEIVETAHNPALRIFNMGVVLFGVAVTVYLFSVVAAFLVEIEATNPFWRRRMHKRISELRDHYIVCGIGDTGRYVAEEMHRTGTLYVVVDLREELIKKVGETHPDIFRDMLYIVGDSTEEETLSKAGIEHAKGLVTALPEDKDNLVVTVIAHQAFPNLRIVARSSDLKFAERMVRAGAKATVSPSHIGGLRMASELIRPHVVGFLDLMLKDQLQTLRVEEIEIDAASPWAGNPLGEIKIHARQNLLVLAVKSAGESANPKLWVNPPDTLMIKPGAAIIVMGDTKDIRKARSEAKSPGAPANA